MSEDGRFGSLGGAPGTGANRDPDLGFFASGPPAARPAPPAPPSQFGAPPTSYVPPQAQQSGLPQSQLSGPPLLGPGPYGPPPPQRSGLPAWAVVVIVMGGILAGLIILGILAAIAIPVFLSQRSMPVTPDRLGGLSRSTDVSMNETLTDVQDGLPKSSNVKSKTAAYGELSDGYVLIAFNAPADANTEFRDLGATTAVQTFGDVRCATNATVRVTLCVRTSSRGAVEVVSFGEPDFPRLSAATDEAWRAQPFGG